MKRLITALMTMTVLAGCVTVQIPPEKARVQRVIEAPALANQQIYDRSKYWIGRYLKAAKEGDAVLNREAGTIEFHGIVPYPAPSFDMLEDRFIRYTLREDMKDGKARLIFDNLRLVHPPSYNKVLGWSGDYETPVESAEDMSGVSFALVSLALELEKYLNDKQEKW